MADLYPSMAQCAVVATALKILLFPAYKSTDFEVHRNWLAITNSLPPQEWYYEKTSEWTLDYPPFFAYFEWILSQGARFVEPHLLIVKNLNYDSWQTVYFQRATVILTELVLVYALHLYVKGSHSKKTAHAAAISILLSPGLLIIDHIHFQYNGFLYGILVLSLVLARDRSTLLPSGLLFASLLCLKHIYLYLAPAYFVYLLRAYCLNPESIFRVRFGNALTLGVGISAVFATAFGPFVYWGQTAQVLSRLFPFSRGLCHAYWAPNVWAMYSFTDRVLIYVAPYVGLTVDSSAVNSVTRGLVGDTSFAVLPDVPPRATFLLTLFFQVIFLIKLFLKPTWDTFVGAVTLCGYASFLFGWHVHEKAILLVIIPFSLLALKDRRYLGAFRPLAVAGHVSLFPLIFTVAEFPVKTVYTIFWLVLFLLSFDRLAPASSQARVFLLDRFTLLYVAVAIPLIVYCSLVHPIVFGQKYEFLPLMFTSSYSAVGVVGSWVYYKRKPVIPLPEPPFLDDHTEVWCIEQTQEVFVDYEKYLARRDFYSQRKFTCNATGHSGLTFFEALESEMDTVKEIDSFFPEALRSRMLHYVQFQRTSRMDDLVNVVFERFREDYMVGDRVVVEEHGSRLHGQIRDITDPNPSSKFNDGTSDSSKPILYYISLNTSNDETTKLGCKEFSRDRNYYSKLLLKSFLRNAVSRENWAGAPWLVKEKLATQYGIDTQVPETKTRDAVMAAKKAANAANANAAAMPPPQHQTQPVEHGGTFFNFLASHNQAQMQNHQHWGADPNRPVLKPQKQMSIEGFARQQQFQMPPHLPGRVAQFLPMQGQNGVPNGVPNNFHHIQPGNGLPINLPFQNQFMQYQVLRPTAPPTHHPAPPAPPPIKYPIEDLDVRSRPDAPPRPQLKFFTDDVPAGVDPLEKKTGILMKSIGPLLCTWETLNVHETVFHLDSFTFDDFVEAMQYVPDPEDCELFVEVHCAVLSQLIDEKGNVLVALPNIEGSQDGSGDGEESSLLSSPEPEVEEKPPARTTRSSLAKSEAAALAKRSPSVAAEPKLVHKAAEFLNDYDWIDRCASRDYVNGGWEAMMVGLIYNVSFIPQQKDVCEEILTQLVPVDEEPTIENVKLHYDNLDVNLRAAALEIACMLSVRTVNFRAELAKAAEEMTKIRKQKIEYQREKKVLVDELQKLDQDRKMKLPANMMASPVPELNGSPDVTMTGTEEPQDAAEAESSAEEEPKRGSRKTRHTKSLKRKREEEEAKKEKAKKDKIEAAKNKQSAEWRELLESIEAKKEEIKLCEDSIEEQDNDLRETSVQRSKCLGKDRFMNRYYWFERNGMPYGGLPLSSTSNYGYANGRLWVQGPDKTEMDPLTSEPMVSKDKEILGITVPERRVKEEGVTRLEDSTQWGYYDDPEAVDKLMGWLDERGQREKALRKDLQIFRDPIIEHMVKMKDHLSHSDDTRVEEDDSPKRSTRRRNSETDVAVPNCCKWTNNIMREEFGYSHSEQGKPKPKPKKGVATKVKAKSKPTTRQGTRYGK
ncbi:uncharacterized protein BDZ99DRAFT_526382 [Mytilinidion resinicola]|uniref:Uncharacterized protein n=1 Tax=Mytilinidion resinicola TaxID=574789 RepID=A0A6A6Y4K8_9PEZI|nr:uncharacterized protein BDZ99DRAFT_526382 [Mytilinidion resinicola]KAF2803453.1 hypothetical protein BDZ99DRAFT_526382 [Mytilinidion resinicola]